MIGKEVICIDNKRVKGKLTVGKAYQVQTHHQNTYIGGKFYAESYQVPCDDGKWRFYSSERFKI